MIQYRLLVYKIILGFIRGHARIACVIPSWRVSWLVWLIYLVLSRTVISEFIGKAYYPPMVILMCPSHFFLLWNFYFYKVRSPTHRIFALTGFSSVSNTDNLSRDLLRSWGSHWCDASCDMSWWFPGCMMHSNIPPSNSSIISHGFLIMSSSIPCAYWRVLLVPEGVRHSWGGSEMFGGYNGVLDLVIPLWPRPQLSFPVVVLGFRCYLMRYLWVVCSLPRNLMTMNTSLWQLHYCCRISSDSAEGERLI